MPVSLVSRDEIVGSLTKPDGARLDENRPFPPTSHKVSHSQADNPEACLLISNRHLPDVGYPWEVTNGLYTKRKALQ